MAEQDHRLICEEIRSAMLRYKTAQHIPEHALKQMQSEVDRFKHEFMSAMHAEWALTGEQPTMCVLPYNSWLEFTTFAKRESVVYDANAEQSESKAQYMGIDLFYSRSATKMIFGYGKEV